MNRKKRFQKLPALFSALILLLTLLFSAQTVSAQSADAAWKTAAGRMPLYTEATGMNPENTADTDSEDDTDETDTTAAEDNADAEDDTQAEDADTEDGTQAEDADAKDGTQAEDADAETGEDTAKETTGWPAPPEIDADAIYLLEPDTGSVLNSKNADKQVYPASTTKILTCLIALQTCSLDETVTFSETAVDLEPGDSNIGAVAGEEMPMRDVLYGLMVASGNECANAIAEHIAGSNDAFAELMNEKAAEIGAANSHFMNPSGLYNSQHYTTAEDLAKIAREAYKNSTFVEIISHREYAIDPTNMDPDPKHLSTTVELINPTSSSYSEYVVGGKTGYLLEAGRCLVSFAKKDGVSFISVLLGAGYEAVFGESLKNLEYGYNNFTIKNVSEYETRFSYMDENCKVYLDPRAEIMTVTSVPFEDLDAQITYVSDMDQETREAIFADLGMKPDADLRLYAELNYSYADHYLGKVYVVIDPAREITQASFVEVTYIKLWYLVGAAVIVLIILIIAAKRPRRKRYR